MARGKRSSFRQTPGVADADIWRSPVRMVRQAAPVHRPPFMQGLLESVGHEARMRCPAHAPADDAPGICINDKGHVDEA